MFETMEMRRLLSGGPTVSQSGSVLTVNAGADGGVVNIYEDTLVDGKVTVEAPNGVVVSTHTGVTVVDFTGQASSDAVFMTGRTVKYEAAGNGGNDMMTISDTGTASSVISGDGGDDDLIILAANKTTVIGDGGGDNVYVEASVGTGETYIYGLGGADQVTTYAGLNHIFGGGGSDTLFNFGGVNIIDSIETVEP